MLPSLYAPLFHDFDLRASHARTLLPRSIGFCATWVCISSSSSSIGQGNQTFEYFPYYPFFISGLIKGESKTCHAILALDADRRDIPRQFR